MATILNSSISGEQLGTWSTIAPKLRKSNSSIIQTLGNLLHTTFYNKASAKELSAPKKHVQQKEQPTDHKVLQQKTRAAQYNEAISEAKQETKIEAGSDEMKACDSRSEGQEPIPYDYDTTLIIAAIAKILAAISEQEKLSDLLIFTFILKAYRMSQWSPEVHVAGCVLLLRWVQNGHQLSDANWRPALLMALLVSQKILDDIPLDNLQFCIIWQTANDGKHSELSLQQVNTLEGIFLKEVDFFAFVDSRTLTEVYHELICLAKENGSSANDTSEEDAKAEDAPRHDSQNDIDKMLRSVPEA